MIFTVVFMFFDLFFIAIIVGTIVRKTWKPFEVLYPAQEPLDQHTGRRFQSFSIGMVGLGMSIHVVIDDEYLHLTPAWFVRVFGLKPVSIPWDEIEPIPAKFSRGKYAKVSINQQKVTGPRWCFQLVLEPAQTFVQ